MTNIFPCLRYRDAKAAITWLCDVFGFQSHLVVPGAGDTIAHAQLAREGAMVMLGSASDNEYSRHMKTPFEVNGANTQSIYLVLADVDAHYDKTVAAGAEVVTALKEEDYGGKGYTCKDLEGHLWSFGSYNPWA